MHLLGISDQLILLPGKPQLLPGFLGKDIRHHHSPADIRRDLQMVPVHAELRGHVPFDLIQAPKIPKRRCSVSRRRRQKKLRHKIRTRRHIVDNRIQRTLLHDRLMQLLHLLRPRRSRIHLRFSAKRREPVDPLQKTPPGPRTVLLHGKDRKRAGKTRSKHRGKHRSQIIFIIRPGSEQELVIHTVEIFACEGKIGFSRDLRDRRDIHLFQEKPAGLFVKAFRGNDLSVRLQHNAGMQAFDLRQMIQLLCRGFQHAFEQVEGKRDLGFGFIARFVPGGKRCEQDPEPAPVKRRDRSVCDLAEPAGIDPDERTVRGVVIPQSLPGAFYCRRGICRQFPRDRDRRYGGEFTFGFIWVVGEGDGRMAVRRRSEDREVDIFRRRG